MQITMLGHITAIFGLSLDKSQILSMIAGIGGTGGATLFGKFLVSSVFYNQRGGFIAIGRPYEHRMA